MKRLEIQARRWFDSKMGNTYFSCQIFVDDKLFHTQCFHYGYERYFENYAANYVNERLTKFPDEFVHAPGRYCRNNDIEFLSNVVDVKRRKDLHGEGR